MRYLIYKGQDKLVPVLLPNDAPMPQIKDYELVASGLVNIPRFSVPVLSRELRPDLPTATLWDDKVVQDLLNDRPDTNAARYAAPPSKPVQEVPEKYVRPRRDISDFVTLVTFHDWEWANPRDAQRRLMLTLYHTPGVHPAKVNDDEISIAVHRTEYEAAHVAAGKWWRNQFKKRK